MYKVTQILTRALLPQFLFKRQPLAGKRVIVTSGGTLAPIDDVRHIGNFSSGAFPARIAEACLLSGAEVFYVHGKGARIPFYKDLNLVPEQPLYKELARLFPLRALYNRFQKQGLLHVFPIRTVPEYAEALQQLLSERPIDIIFLGMAVSDYGIEPAAGKISSASEALSLTLTRNMKVIAEIKKWSQGQVFQIGFKLLSGVARQTLIDTAYASLLGAKSNLVLANDLQEIRSGNRTMYMVTPEKGVQVIGHAPDMASRIVEYVAKRSKTTHFKTIISGEANVSVEHEEEYALMKQWGHLLAQIGFMTPYLPGDKRLHGSLAIRIPETNKFLITARNSNKGELAVDDVVLIDQVDFAARKIFTKSLNDRKGSLNVPLVAEIFRKYPEINAVVHTHNGLDNVPTSEFPHMPGTVEYVEATMQVLDMESPLIMLKEHGLLAIGSDLQAASELLLTASLKANSSTGENHAYRNFPDTYDLIYQKYAGHIDDFVKLITRDLDPGATILDAAAGTGLVTLALAKQGFNVTAADLHLKMLVVLDQKRRAQHLPEIKLVNQAFQELEFDQEFDVVEARQSINYLVGWNNLVEGLKRIRKALKPGGRLIFNAPNYDPSQKEFPDRVYQVQEGNLGGIVLEWNTVEGAVLTHHHDCLVWDETEPENIRALNDTNIFQMYTADEFRIALVEAGFLKIQFYSSGLQPFNSQDKTLYVEATR